MKGDMAMARKIRVIAKNNPRRVMSAIYKEGQIEMVESKRRCPVSPLPAPPGVVPGTLRASGTVNEPEQHGTNIVCMLSYGGFGSGAEDYAIVQHENLEYHHTTGQAKYLESVLNESAPYMAGRIGRRMNLNQALDPVTF